MRVLGSTGTGTAANAALAIGWAEQHGANIINLSLGGPDWSQTLQDAINLAHGSGSLIIAAMGNQNTNAPYYPAACENVFAVSATTQLDGRAPYSNYGSHNDIAAPGGSMSYYGQTTGIYSTMPTYPVYMTTQYGYVINYDYLQGTSQAAPYVSGLAALIWSLSPGLTPDQVQQAIESTADDLDPAGWDQVFGWGRINARAAVVVVLARGYCPYPVHNRQCGSRWHILG